MKENCGKERAMGELEIGRKRTAGRGGGRGGSER